MPGDAGSAIIHIKADVKWDNLKDLETKIADLESKPHVIDIKVNATGAGQQVKELLGQLKNIKKNYANLSIFKDGSSGGGKSGDSFQQMKKRVKAVEDLDKRLDKYRSSLSKAKDAGVDQSSNAYEQLKKNINVLQHARDEFAKGAKDPLKNLGDIENAIKSCSRYKGQIEEMTEAQKELQKSFSFKDMESGAEKVAAKIKKGYSDLKGYAKKGVSEDNSDFQKILQNINGLEELQKKMLDPNSGLNVADASSQYKEFAANILAAGTNLEKLVYSQEQAANAQKVMKQGTEEYAKGLAEIEKTQSKVDQFLGYTAAKNGKSKEAYANIVEQAQALKELHAEYAKGDMLESQYKQRLDDINKTIDENGKVIKSNGEAMSSFSSDLKGGLASFGRILGQVVTIQKLISQAKQMVQASMDIESAMTRIQIVTGATDTQMNHFFNTAAGQAKDLGKSITDVAGSIETFSRLGYNLEDATNLSKFANIMANVGDVSVDEATTGMTSIIKGFGLTANDAEHVSDVLIQVGQKYAISASELMQAFERGGASMNAANTSFEESAALFAATNAALQNASKTGTLWNTVSARIRSATAELEEMGESTEDLAGGFSKYRDELLARTGVDIQDSLGNYRSMLDIFTDIAAVWDNMADEQSQSRVAEILGGTRNRAGIMSTIQNIADAQKAFSDATNSENVALEANAKYMDTAAAHVGQFKAAWQEMSYDLFDDSLLKKFIDFGSGTVGVIDDITKSLGSLGTMVAGGALAASIKTVFSAMSGKDGVPFLEALKQISLPGIGIAAGITAVSAIYTAVKQTQEMQHQQALDAGEAYEDTIKSLDEYGDRIVELKQKLADNNTSEAEAYEAKKQLLDIQNQLTEAYGKSAEAVNLLNESETQSLEKLLEIRRAAAGDLLAEDIAGYEDAKRAMEKVSKDNLGTIDINSEQGKAIQGLTQKYDDLIDIQQKLNDSDWNAFPDGFFDISINGNPEEKAETLYNYINDLIRLKRSFERENKDTNIIDDAIRYASDAYNKSNSIIDAYKSIIDEHNKALFDLDDTQFRFNLYDSDHQNLKKTEVKSAIEWLEDYINAIEDYNEALTSGDSAKIKEAASAFNYYDQAIQSLIANTSMGEYAKYFADVRSQLLDSLISQSEFDNAINGSPTDRLGKFAKNAADHLKEANVSAEDFKNTYADILSGKDIKSDKTTRMINDMVEAALRFGLISDKSLPSVESLVSMLVDWGVVSADVSSKNDEITTSLQKLSSYQSTLVEAMNASKSATGMTTDQVDSLKESYKEIFDNPDFDPVGLFEATANGIHLNQKALKDLNDQIEAKAMLDYANQLKAATEEYNNLTEAEKKGTRGKEILQKIQAIKLEEAAYEGSISAFNKWQQAQSQTDERANYEAVGEGYKGIKDLIEHGWINDAEVGSYLDLILGKVDALGEGAKRTGDNLADFAKLTETNKYGHSIIDDYWSYGEDGKLNPLGLETFMRDVNAFDSSIVEMQEGADGTSFKVNMLGDNLAKVSREFGLSAEMIQLMERAMIDAGAEMVFDSTNLGLMADQVQKFAAESEILQKYDWGDVANWDAETITNAIKDLGIAADGANSDVQQLYQTMQESLQNQKLKVDIEAEVQNGTTLEEMSKWTDEDIKAHLGVDVDVEEARAAIQELENEANNVDLIVHIDDSQFAQLTGETEEINDVEVGVTYKELDEPPKKEEQMTVNVSYVDENEPPKKDETMTVKVRYEDENASPTGNRGPKDLVGRGTSSTSKDNMMTVKVNYVDQNEPPKTEEEMTVNVTYVDTNEKPGSTGQNDYGRTTLVGHDVTTKYTVEADEKPVYEDQNPQVTYDVDAPPEPVYSSQNPTVVYHMHAPSEPSYNNIERTVTYTIKTIGSPPSGGGVATASGTMTSFGVAHANGTAFNGPWNWRNAYAGGKVGLSKSEIALVNELGTESIIRNGQWLMLPGGMHMEALKKGDIVLSAQQTADLLSSGKATGHGHAYALGSLISNAYAGGAITKWISNALNTAVSNMKSSVYSGISGNWKTSRPYTNTSSSGSGSGGGGGGGGGNSKSDDADDELEKMDWIEVAIDRIERAIKKLGVTAKSTFQTLSTRLKANADEIVEVTKEIELQQKAYDRYIKEADSVGLSEELAKKVREGTIDINEYDKDTKKLIDDYQEWYEKALDCDEAIQQLHEDLGQLYEDRFNDTKDDFDAQLDLLKHLTTTYENGMDDIEARGYLATTRYYEAMRKVENQNIALMNKELDALIEKMSQAVNSGEIKEGSQAWYEMQQEINGVKEAIQEAETSVIELGNKIREVLWDRFDYLQDRISQITDEGEFMMELLSHSDMTTKTGLLTSEGLATMGLHAQNYDVYMNQADRYAAEVKKLNAELAKDPNNTILLEQKQKWIEAQRESILNAEEEKEAMISLVEEGVQAELSALSELINKYKDSLDNAKNLYDYQKKISEQSKKISSIQKQLRAYSGDDSEETRAITQKLSVDLSDAMEKLQETQYQKQVSDQKAMLSNLYDAYELILNQRLDNVDALMADLIQMVNLNSGATQESIAALKEANGGYVNVINGQISYVGGQNSSWFNTLNGTAMNGYAGVQNGVAVSANSMIANDNAGYQSIKDTLASSTGTINSTNASGYQSIKDMLNYAATDVGYTISDEMRSIWSDSGDANRVVALYGDLVGSKLGTTNGKLDTVNEIIAGIAANVASMVQKSDEKATATVKATTSSTKTNTAAKPVTQTTTTPKKTETKPAASSGRTQDEKYGVAIAIWNGTLGWGAGEDRKKKLTAKGFNYDEMQKIVNEVKPAVLNNTWSSKYGIKDLSKYAYNKFKMGGLVDYTGLAQVDGTPGKPEAFLNAEDTKNLTILKDTLRNIMNGNASLTGSAASLGLFAGLSGIKHPQGMRASAIGDITYQINIPIDHVTDYDDFVNKMRNDTKFERLIQSMTIDQLAGQSSIAKNKYKW